jgi:hypothetical protein
MSQRFIKFIPSDETRWLIQYQPNAFLLLSLIADRARVFDGLADGLRPGQCHIGDHKSCGLSERQYRTAKTVLVIRKHIRIIETCRNRKKSTTGATTKGTLVELISSTVYDINKNCCDDRSDDRATTERRPSDDEQERIRRNKMEEQKQQAVVVFPSLASLEDHSLSWDHKMYICASYSQEVVDNAVAVISDPKFERDGTMLKALRAACKGAWKPNKGDVHALADNRKLAHNLEGKRGVCEYLACSKYLEIIKGPKAETISYDMPSDKFRSEIERIGKISLDKTLKSR